MTRATTGTPRDDLFTHIHKALRLALFELAIQAGRTDWTSEADVADLDRVWQAVLALLRVHSAHEDRYIFRLLDDRDPLATEPAADQHRDLDDLLEHVAQRFQSVVAEPDPATGLALYRDLNRFIAAYLPHLHEEETHVMARIWECCSDEEIAATRAAFMADTPPDVQATALQYVLAAIDPPTRRVLTAR